MDDSPRRFWDGPTRICTACKTVGGGHRPGCAFLLAKHVAGPGLVATAMVASLAAGTLLKDWPDRDEREWRKPVED